MFIKQKLQTKSVQKHFYSIHNNSNPYKITVKSISANSFQLLILATNFKN